MGGKGNQNIFQMWLKNFIALVFTQAFQAVFMMFIIYVTYSIMCGSGASEATVTVKNDWNDSGALNHDFIISMVVFVGLGALVKMEKLVRGIFGIEDTPLIGDMGKQMKTMLIAGKQLTDMAKKTAEPFKQSRDAKKNLDAARAKRQRIANRVNQNMKYPVNGGNGGVPVLQAGGTGGAGNGSVQGTLEGETANRVASGLENLANVLESQSPTSNGATDFSKKGADFWADDSNFDAEGKVRQRFGADIALDNAAKEEGQAQLEYEKAKRRRIGRLVTTVGSAGVAYGGTDSMAEFSTTASTLNSLTDPIADKMANKVGAKAIAKQMQDLQEAINDLGSKKGSAGLEKARKITGMSGASRAELGKELMAMREAYASVGSKISEELNESLEVQASQWLKDYTSEVKKADGAGGKIKAAVTKPAGDYAKVYANIIRDASPVSTVRTANERVERTVQKVETVRERKRTITGQPSGQDSSGKDKSDRRRRDNN